jgi:regulator of replication initiation timing
MSRGAGDEADGTDDEESEKRDGQTRELLARVDALSQQVDSLRDQLRDAEAEREALQNDVAELREENEDLRGEIERLDARTDLLDVLEEVDSMDGRQRSVALIQHLRRAAERQRERGRPAKASVNRDEAESALQYPDVERTTIYRDMNRAARLVGDESVLRYDSDTGGDSRLRLNLEDGNLPGSVAGKRIDGGD